MLQHLTRVEPETTVSGSTLFSAEIGFAMQCICLLAITGRVEEAKNEMRRALAIDPTSYNFLADLGQMQYFVHEYDDAESYCEKALEIHPNFIFARQYLVRIHLKKGEDEKALEAMIMENRAYYPSSTYPKTKDRPAQIEARRRHIYRDAGLRGVLKDQLREQFEGANSFSHFGVVLNYTLQGEKEKALEHLEKSYENREFLLLFVNAASIFDDLRSDPRFPSVLRRMGLAS